MSYHVYNAMKLKVLLAIQQLEAQGAYADLNTISENIDVKKKNLAPNLINYVKYKYITKRKYNTHVKMCRHYYTLTKTGERTIELLVPRVEKHQTLNLRKAPVVLDSGYVKGKENDEERERKRNDKLSPILRKHREMILKSLKMGTNPSPEEKEEFNAANIEFTAMLNKAIPT